MRADLPIAVLLLAASALPSLAQGTSRNGATQPPPTGAVVAPPIIACASLANLRAVLRSAKDDAAAAIPQITDPKSDLGCNVLDKRVVTGIADHVALNGKAYDCLSLQTTGVCQWTVGGSVKPVATNPAGGRDAVTPPSQARGKR